MLQLIEQLPHGRNHQEREPVAPQINNDLSQGHCERRDTACVTDSVHLGSVTEIIAASHQNTPMTHYKMWIPGPLPPPALEDWLQQLYDEARESNRSEILIAHEGENS